MRFLLLLIITFISLPSLAQRVNISLDKNNVIHKGFSNPITVFAENHDCDEIELESNKLTIKKMLYQNGVECKYNLSTDSLGRAAITIYSLKNKKRKKIGIRHFQIRPMHQPIPFVAGKSKGKINKNTLLVQQAVFAKLLGYPGSVHYVVTQFTVVADIKHEHRVTRKTFYTNRFTDELRAIIRGMAPGDDIYFLNVHTSGPGLKDCRLNTPLWLTIE